MIDLVLVTNCHFIFKAKLAVPGLQREGQGQHLHRFHEVPGLLQTSEWHHGKYWVTQKLPQIYTASHANFPIRIRKITTDLR